MAGGGPRGRTWRRDVAGARLDAGALAARGARRTPVLRRAARRGGHTALERRATREGCMESKVNYTVVGAFVLVLSALLVAGILWFASGGGFQKSYDSYLALVDESVAGLS